MESRITAFPDGNSFVSVDHVKQKLVVGNSNGLVKIFNKPEESDLEPLSLDILENITNITIGHDTALITTTSGKLESVKLLSSLSGESSGAGELYRSELPLRDAVFINEGKRIVVGGDDSSLVVLDIQAEPYAVSKIPVNQSVVGLSYNGTGEMVAASLLNGKVAIFSVINEIPTLLETVDGCIREKVNTSMDELDYVDEHKAELFSTKTVWSANGEYLVIPQDAKVLKIFNRSNWKSEEYTIGELDSDIIDFDLSPSGDFVAVVDRAHQLNVYQFGKSSSRDPVKSIDLTLTSSKKLPLNLSWYNNRSGVLDLYVGTTNGDVITIEDVVKNVTSDVEKLFLDQAEDSEAEEERNAEDLFGDGDDDIIDEKSNTEEIGSRFDMEDSMVIDEDDEEPRKKRSRRSPPNGYSYNHERRQRNTNSLSSASTAGFSGSKLAPFSPGSTPWNADRSSTTARRYLTINSFGYTWAVRSDSTNQQQSITVSFFDRAVNKDYHFTDYNKFDLCSMNARGVLLGNSGLEKGNTSGKIFYRHHESLQDSWDQKIPLLKGEFITSLTLTDKSESEEIIVVGTNFGYVRFFNLYGVCIYLMKSTPVVSLIASGAIVFLINEVSQGLSYTYSVLNVNEDYRYIQQDITLPLLRGSEPLIKGIFFNEYNDPCLVSGHDDTLIILSNWRESNNGKWIPILNLEDCITEGGNNESKKHWKSWPLGLYKDKASVLILKSGNTHPGFPLPLPVEVSIKLPVKNRDPKKRSTGDEGEEEDVDASAAETEAEDPGEAFLRAATMGRIVHASLEDIDDEDGDNDEIVERLEAYSMTFDKSLLKIFAQACQDAQLSRAFSVAKLIKTDKALFAASKIAERMEYLSLAQRLGKLREDLLDDA